jgi:hypothetical protein
MSGSRERALRCGPARWRSSRPAVWSAAPRPTNRFPRLPRHDDIVPGSGGGPVDVRRRGRAPFTSTMTVCPVPAAPAGWIGAPRTTPPWQHASANCALPLAADAPATTIRSAGRTAAALAPAASPRFVASSDETLSPGRDPGVMFAAVVTGRRLGYTPARGRSGCCHRPLRRGGPLHPLRGHRDRGPGRGLCPWWRSATSAPGSPASRSGT